MKINEESVGGGDAGAVDPKQAAAVKLKYHGETLRVIREVLVPKGWTVNTLGDALGIFLLEKEIYGRKFEFPLVIVLPVCDCPRCTIKLGVSFARICEDHMNAAEMIAAAMKPEADKKAERN